MITQALILAGGKGSRLDPLGDYLPKCLATVYNRPLIDYQLRQLESVGVKEVYVAVSTRHHAVIAESLACLEREQNIHLLEEDKPAGIAALFEAGAHLPEKPFWLVLGDLFFGTPHFSAPTLSHDEDLEAILFTRKYDSLELLSAETSNIVVEGDRVVGMLDKPPVDRIRGNLGWYATAIVTPAFLSRRQAILDWCAQNRPHAHVGDLFQAAIALGAQIGAAPGPGGAWINVNTPDQLLKASQYVRNQGEG
jgi:NDP-sugar pyrophosphorylase family protein